MSKVSIEEVISNLGQYLYSIYTTKLSFLI